MGLKNFKQCPPLLQYVRVEKHLSSQKLASEELKAFDSLSLIQKVFKGDKLFRKADSFKYLYCVRIGSFKTSVTSPEGTEQVTGFYMPGEVLGLCGVSSNSHYCDATAIEDAEVCVIPYKKFEEFCNKDSQLNKNFLSVLSAEVVRGHKKFALPRFSSR